MTSHESVTAVRRSAAGRMVQPWSKAKLQRFCAPGGREINQLATSCFSAFIKSSGHSPNTIYEDGPTPRSVPLS